ncbi:WD40/YVTN/BNR-like repeat-containing protein [Candidatus Omnitrophota bacterium]
MKRNISNVRPIVVFVVTVFLLIIGARTAICKTESLWQQHSIGIQEREINCIGLDPHNPQTLYIGTNRAIYKTEDSGKNWKSLLRIPGSNTSVNFIYVDVYDADWIYAATTAGLFKSKDSGRTWKEIYNSVECLSIAAGTDDELYVGTEAGLVVSWDSEKNWQEISGVLRSAYISFITVVEDQIYVVTDTGLFRVDNDIDTAQRIFVATQSTDDEFNVFEDESATGNYSDITQVSVDPLDSERIYFSSSSGIFLSLDQGVSWERLSTQGLLSKAVNSFVVISPEQIFAATDKGVFQFDGTRWHQINQGMISKDVNFIASIAADNVWAATDRGVYRLTQREINTPQNIDYRSDMLESFEHEPSIQEIQRKAIDYAEVAPGKISKWRAQASKSAWLPRLTIGADGANNKTFSDSVWGSYSSGGQHHVGPDDKTFYDNFGWDASLTWDFGDLIWNNDQTSIDSRSKLMVELREDILDEVTRLFFERRRLQIELATVDTATLERQQLELQLQELTALIDALTGGYLSRSLKANIE